MQSTLDKDRFIKLHPSFHHAQDLKEICAPLNALNIVYFSHVQIDKKNRFSSLGVKPEFAKIYFEKEYYRFDVHMAQLPQTESYIIWDNIALEKESRELENDFMDFNLGHTFTICQQHDNYTDYFHFATKLGHAYMNQQYFAILGHLQQFIYYYRDKLQTHSDLRRAFEYKLAIPNGNFATAEEPLNLFAPDSQLSALKRIYLNHHSYLTAREFDCLKHLATGITLSEAAEHMGITARTAKAHLQNIKDKFGCKTQFELGSLFASIKTK